ncbi:hypothetical protein H4219_002285 [Mycoemilia scoparia]|uniref:Peptide hydrolase n=1 Tax=Mycoemilia scoparia TaxID=417184 RepID=A0A9W8A2V0_9FUNG|nr:hypothetical protein H4219_002285 [Mycoemilia scoparia]
MVLDEKRPMDWRLPPLGGVATTSSQTQQQQTSYSSHSQDNAYRNMAAERFEIYDHDNDNRYTKEKTIYSDESTGLLPDQRSDPVREPTTIPKVVQWLATGYIIWYLSSFAFDLYSAWPSISFCFGCHRDVKQTIPTNTIVLAKELAAMAEDKSNTVAWDRLAEMTDMFGHRMTGSEGYDRSVEWILSTARTEDNLVAVAENVTVNVWQRGKESLQLITKTRPDNDGIVDLPLIGLGMSASTPPEGIEADVVPVSSFEELASLGNATVSGKIVLINAPFETYGDSVGFRSRSAVEAEKYGAVGVLVRSITPFSMVNPHTGYSAPAGIPAAAVTAEDANLIERMYRRAVRASQKSASPKALYGHLHGFPRVRLAMQSEYKPSSKQSANVILELKGSEFPEEIVLISGHLDSWDVGVGALDDGAGAFAAWEALRMISMLKQRPKRTIRVVMWNNEETFQAGAKEYYEKHRSEISNHVFALESDIGIFKPWGLALQTGNKKLRKFLDCLGYTFLSGYSAGHIVAADRSPGEDIDVLCKDGVPCAGLLSWDPVNGKAPTKKEGFNGYFYYHHSAADRMEVLDPHDVRASSASIAVWAYLVSELPRDLL